MINKNVKVSIITPCFNSENTIRDTFEHILNQTYSNIEYIVVDGSSKDGTLDIIHEYENKFPFAFKYISESDNGIYDAMNKGVKMATGEIIGIVNSDDWYENDAIENVIANYQGNEYEVVYGMKRVIDQDKERMIEFKHHDFLHQQMICHPTCFITKKTYADLGIYDTKYKSSADYDLMLRFYDSGKVVFTPVYKVIANFRVGGMSGSQVGYRETLKLKLRSKTITSNYYWMCMVRSYLSEFLHK